MLDLLPDLGSLARPLLPFVSLSILSAELLIVRRLLGLYLELRGKAGGLVAALMLVVTLGAAGGEMFSLINAVLLVFDPVGSVDFRSVTFLMREIVILGGVAWAYRRFAFWARPIPVEEYDPFEKPFGDL